MNVHVWHRLPGVDAVLDAQTGGLSAVDGLQHRLHPAHGEEEVVELLQMSGSHQDVDYTSRIYIHTNIIYTIYMPISHINITLDLYIIDDIALRIYI